MKIVVLSGHTKSLFWFRKDLMESFLKLGHTVYAIGSESPDEWTIKFSEMGVEYRQISIQRNGLNPLNDLEFIKKLYRILNELKPDKIFSYQAKTIIYGSISSSLNSISEYYPLVAGLGSVFRGRGTKNMVLKTILRLEYRLAFKLSKQVIFQNEDDGNYCLDHKIVSKEKIRFINGSGVNLDSFKPQELSHQTCFLFIGRLIKDKGIVEYLEASKKIKEKYPDCRCLLVGPYDTNPSALKEKELRPYIDDNTIEYFGEQEDVRPFLQQCTTFVLPSYHEGTPKTVLEAMAASRAIITTDAPGCRETVINGQNGFLVQVKNSTMLYHKMEYLHLNPDINRQMGQRSLELVREKFDVKLVNESIHRIMGLVK